MHLLPSTDYLEHFFSLVRQHGGWNDNPTPVQFKYIMRKLIVMKFGGLTPSLNGNCSIVDVQANETEEGEDNNLEEVIEYARGFDGNRNIDDMKNRLVAYIGGYVVSKLSPTLKCNYCGPAFEDSVEDPLDPSVSKFLRLKDRGGLKHPSGSTYRIVAKAEEVFMTEIAAKKKLPDTPNLLTHLSMKVLRLLDVSKLFPTLTEHVLEQNPAIEEIHHIKLTKR